MKSGDVNYDNVDLEWEEWKPTEISFRRHMLAGSVAGLAEHITMFPVDTIKTHVQCQRCGSNSPMQTWNCASRIIGNNGLFSLWRGVSAMFAGCIPGQEFLVSIIFAITVEFQLQSACGLFWDLRIVKGIS